MKKITHKIKYQNETIFFMKESKDGVISGFPKENPLYHLTCIFKQERFSCHVTKDKGMGGNRYDKNNRFEINLSNETSNRLAQFDAMKYAVECDMSKLPGKVYLSGGFHTLMDETTQQSKVLLLEDFINKVYIVKARHLRFCRNKMWHVLDKEKGKNGRWYDIGFLYGPFNGRTFYSSYKSLNEMLSSLMEILKADNILGNSLMIQGADVMFNLNQKVKNLLMRNGKRTVRSERY